MAHKSNNNRTGTVYDKVTTDFIRKILNDGISRVEMDEDRGVVLHSLDGMFEDWKLEGIVIQKKCGKCKEELPLYDFGSDQYRLDNYNKYCKKCYKKKPKRKYWDNYRYEEDDNIYQRRPTCYRYEHEEKEKDADLDLDFDFSPTFESDYEPWMA